MTGEVKAQKMIVAGRFFGNAECESIELVAGGEVEGTLTTASLAIDIGSSFQGESIRRKPGDPPPTENFPTTPDPFKDNNKSAT